MMQPATEMNQAQNENRLPARTVMLPAQKAGIDYRTKTVSDRIQVLSVDVQTGTAVFSLTPEGIGRDVILHIGDVTTALRVFVNDRYVGHAHPDGMAAEFDITDFVVANDENTLFLESPVAMLSPQDVCLICQNKVCLWDYEFKTTQSSLAVVLYPNKENNDLRAEVSFDRRTRWCDLHTETSVKFDLPAPETWNAENPYLYELVITVFQGDKQIEVHSKKIGLRESGMEDGFFCVNEHPVVFCGINLYKGLSCAETEAELSLLRACHCNAVRLSETSFSPALYEFCNEKGIYVIDDADGTRYHRIKNETCTVAYVSKQPDALKIRLNRKPILAPTDDAAEPHFSDFRHLYAPDAARLSTEAERDTDVPALVTAYGGGHGVSVSEVWDVLDETPQMQGAFLGMSAEERLFDEKKKPCPILYEAKYGMSPLKIRHKDGKLQIYCRNAFERLDNCTMIWNLCEDTVPLENGIVTGLGFAPGELATMDAPVSFPTDRVPGAVYYINIMIFAGERDLGYAQIVSTVGTTTVPVIDMTDTVPLTDAWHRIPLSVPPETVLWYGRGWQENTPTQKACTLIGKYTAMCSDLCLSEGAEINGGMRCNTRYVALYDAYGEGILVCGHPSLSFAVRCEEEQPVLYIRAESDAEAVFTISPYCGEEDALRRVRGDFAEHHP